MLIANIWIKHHLKMFVYLCWFNWSIIKVYNWVQWGSTFPTKYNFLSLLVRVRVKVYFPLKSLVTYFLYVLIKIAHWSINISKHRKQRSVISN